MSPPLLPQDITMTSETEETVLAEALAMTGLKTPAELIDMANVGQSLMERIADLIKQDGPFKGWMPADDPAEIVFDLVNHYEDAALSRAPEAEELGSSTRMTSPASRSQTPLSAEWWTDPAALHINMLRGGVAKLTAAQVGHLYRGAEAAAVVAEVLRQNPGIQPDDGGEGEAIIRELQNIRIGMMDHYQAATVLERLVRAARDLPKPPADTTLSGPQRSEVSPQAPDEPASSPPSTGGEGEPWDRIPPAKRFGRRLDESAVKHLAPGTLLRFYSEDPWFDPSPSSPANGDIVVFTGEVSNTFPKVGPHLEVRTLGGRVYPGGGWVYQIFQFVADPSPEMGEIIRELQNIRVGMLDHYQAATMLERLVQKAQALKLKENGLSREELGGSAGAGSGAACPSDCAEGHGRRSDGGRV